MKTPGTGRHFAGQAFFWVLAALFSSALGALATVEETLDLLETGTHSYQHVTVTTKAKN